MKMMLEPSKRLDPNPHIRWRRQGQGGILLNTCTSEVYNLNESAMRMWRLLMEGKTPQDVIGEIAQETGAETRLVKADLDGFLASMLHAGVLCLLEDDGHPCGGKEPP
jgi:hypothetical protein